MEVKEVEVLALFPFLLFAFPRAARREASCAAVVPAGTASTRGIAGPSPLAV